MNNSEKSLAKEVYENLIRISSKASRVNSYSYNNLLNIVGDCWKTEDIESESGDGLLTHMIAIEFTIERELDNAIERLDKLQKRTEGWKRKDNVN